MYKIKYRGIFTQKFIEHGETYTNFSKAYSEAEHKLMFCSKCMKNTTVLVYNVENPLERVILNTIGN